MISDGSNRELPSPPPPPKEVEVSRGPLDENGHKYVGLVNQVNHVRLIISDCYL